MAEENKGIQVPGEKEGAAANPTDFETRQNEAIVNRASKLGWKPKEEYEGDPSDWRPAKEFLERQSFFDKIKSVKDDLHQSRQENRRLQRDLEEIKKYVKNMSEIEYKRAVADLQSQKAQAVSEADVEAVKNIDAQIDKLRETKEEVKAEQVNIPAGPPPEFNAWVEKNQWYNEDDELRNQADEFGYGILAKNRGLPVEEVLRQVEVKIKKMYPERFPQANKRPNAPSVEGGGGNGSGATPRSKTRLSVGDLDETQKKAMDAFVKRGVLTQEQYLDSLAKSMGMK